MHFTPLPPIKINKSFICLFIFTFGSNFKNFLAHGSLREDHLQLAMLQMCMRVLLYARVVKLLLLSFSLEFIMLKAGDNQTHQRRRANILFSYLKPNIWTWCKFGDCYYAINLADSQCKHIFFCLIKILIPDSLNWSNFLSFKVLFHFLLTRCYKSNFYKNLKGPNSLKLIKVSKAIYRPFYVDIVTCL